MTTTTTVRQLFAWYAGADWKQDWQITNTMTVDGAHTQDRFRPNGEEAVDFLVRNENEEIEVTSEDGGNAYDISFSVKGIMFEMQACEAFS